MPVFQLFPKSRVLDMSESETLGMTMVEQLILYLVLI